MAVPPARPASSRRVFAASVASAGLLLVTGTRESAALRAWCRTDPVVIIGDDLADVFVSGPLSAPLKVTGPNTIVVTVPLGVRAEVILPDPIGFGRGNEFRFAESSKLRRTEAGIEVTIVVRVPARDDEMPVKAEFAPRVLGLLRPDFARGAANEWVTLRTRL
jgi:hypothetical protein